MTQNMILQIKKTRLITDARERECCSY